MLWLALACGPDQRLVAWERDPVAAARDRERVLLELAQAAKPFPGAPGQPDIVVIVLDTVRADHLGVYGYDRATTPQIDAWARDARVFTRMTAVSPWTLPSHASLFTGDWPRTHGAHGVPDGIAAPLASGTPTAARALRSAGYLTIGIAANQAFLDRSWGLAQGFAVWFCEQFESDARRTPYPTADRITDTALAALERRTEAPLFLFLNYMDAHSPWIPREGYVRDPSAIDRRVLPFSDGWEELKLEVMADRKLDSRTIASWAEAYDSELRYLDEHVGRLLSALPAYGIGPEDEVFILSDHGEYLGEHFLVEHSKDVYDTVLHVPLLARGPGFAPGRDDTPLQHTDVARWLMDGVPGSTSPDPARLQVSELYYTRKQELRNPRYAGRFDRIRRAFRVGDHSLILGSDGSREAYDLAVDPGQLRPVDAPWASAMEAAASAWLLAHPEKSATAEAATNIEVLKALGYL